MVNQILFLNGPLLYLELVTCSTLVVLGEHRTLRPARTRITNVFTGVSIRSSRFVSLFSKLTQIQIELSISIYFESYRLSAGDGGLVEVDKG